jgi:hypothetical protein
MQCFGQRNGKKVLVSPSLRNGFRLAQLYVLGALDWILVSLAGHTSAWFLLSSAFARSSENINFVSVFVQSEKFNLTPHQLAFVVLKGRAQTLLTDARQSASNLQRYSPYVPHLFYSEYMPSDGFFDGIFYYEEFQTLL